MWSLCCSFNIPKPTHYPQITRRNRTKTRAPTTSEPVRYRRPSPSPSPTFFYSPDFSLVSKNFSFFFLFRSFFSNCTIFKTRPAKKASRTQTLFKADLFGVKQLKTPKCKDGSAENCCCFERPIYQKHRIFCSNDFDCERRSRYKSPVLGNQRDIEN